MGENSQFHEKTAVLLAHRIRCFACYRGVAQAWPGGVVPVGTAARMLGMSRQRFRKLMVAGRVPFFEMPTGSESDRLVPVDFLMGLSSPLDSGRGRNHHLPETEHRRGSVPKNIFEEAANAASEPPPEGQNRKVPNKIVRARIP